MTGGIRRRATAIHQIGEESHVVLLDTGNFTSTSGRQSEMKAETMAESLAKLNATAIGFTAQDARLGIGTISAMARLSEGRLLSTDFSTAPVEGLEAVIERGPFAIGSVSPSLGGVLSRPSRTPEEAVAYLVATAKSDGKLPVLLLDAPRDVAASLAAKFPALAAIVYRRAGWPPDSGEKVGNVWLLTPGERGKAIVRLSYTEEGGLDGYASTKLGPEFSDDPEVARLYRTYLARVDSANLLDRIPRAPSDPFSGSASCAKCHANADKVWKHSAHSHALTTLEKDGHGRDPDCVGCHVTALDREGGFVSRLKSRAFAAVGCESCHGPAGKHAAAPKKFPLPRVGKKPCFSCHTTEQSPHFDFLTYWKKIAH